MTTLPPVLREPLRKFDRIAGPTILIVGALLFAAVLVWLGLYLNERNLDLFFSEWAYWLPVTIFLLPAIHLIYHGREMTLGRSVSLFTYFEIVVILVVLTVVGLIRFN